MGVPIFVNRVPEAATDARREYGRRKGTPGHSRSPSAGGKRRSTTAPSGSNFIRRLFLKHRLAGPRARGQIKTNCRCSSQSSSRTRTTAPGRGHRPPYRHVPRVSCRGCAAHVFRCAERRLPFHQRPCSGTDGSCPSVPSFSAPGTMRGRVGDLCILKLVFRCD